MQQALVSSPGPDLSWFRIEVGWNLGSTDLLYLLSTSKGWDWFASDKKVLSIICPNSPYVHISKGLCLFEPRNPVVDQFQIKPLNLTYGMGHGIDSAAFQYLKENHINVDINKLHIF